MSNVRHQEGAAIDSSSNWPPRAPGLAGVEGWLLLLVIGLTVIGPLLGAGRLNVELIAAEAQFPRLKTLETWGALKSATWWAYLVFAALSFYAGIGLARGRTISVVTRAKVLIWVIGPFASVVLAVLIPLAVVGKANLDAQLIGSLLVSVVVAVLWTAYLSKSKRVRATYGVSAPDV